MKQPKKLTRNQKEMLKAEGLLPEEWMLKDEDNISICVINKQTKEIRLIWKS